MGLCAEIGDGNIGGQGGIYGDIYRCVGFYRIRSGLTRPYVESN